MVHSLCTGDQGHFRRLHAPFNAGTSCGLVTERPRRSRVEGRGGLGRVNGCWCRVELLNYSVGIAAGRPASVAGWANDGMNLSDGGRDTR